MTTEGPQGQATVRERLRRHWRWAVALLLACLGAGAGAWYQAHRRAVAREHWRQAQLAVDECAFDEAQEHLRAHLRLSPKSAETHFLLAQACRRARNEENALAQHHLDESARLGWPADEVGLELALLDCQRSGSRPESEARLRTSLEARPDREPLILEALARGCLRGGLVNRANAWLDRWVRNHPRDWYARLWRGALFQHQGKPHLAVEDYRQVLRHRPEDPEVVRRLGLVLAASGHDYHEAMRLLERSRETGDADPDVLVALAQCSRVLRGPREARSLLGQVLSEHPRHAEALLALAVVEMDLGQDQESLRALERLEPLATAFDDRAALERLLRLDPVASHPHVTEHREKVLHLKANVLRKLRRDDEARACQRQLQQLQATVTDLNRLLREQKTRPRDPELLFEIGRLHLDLGMGEEAEQWLRRALQVNPADRRAQEALRRSAEVRRQKAEGKR